MYDLPNELILKILGYVEFDNTVKNKYNKYLYDEFKLDVPTRVIKKYNKQKLSLVKLKYPSYKNVRIYAVNTNFLRMFDGLSYAS